MVHRWHKVMIAATAATGAGVLMAVPAGADHQPGGGPAQTVSAALSSSAIQGMRLAEVCREQDGTEVCQTVDVPAQEAQQLGVSLAYALASAAHLPSVDADAGTPDACEVTDPITNAVTERVGAAVQATGASFRSGSAVSMFVTTADGTREVPVIEPGSKATTYSSLGASICLVPVP